MINEIKNHIEMVIVLVAAEVLFFWAFSVDSEKKYKAYNNSR